METEWRRQALQRFEEVTEVPLLVLALTMIPVLVVPLFVDVSAAVDGSLVAASWFIWATFAAEYAIRLTLSTERLRFVRRNLLDLIIVALPLLRPLRVVRSVRAARFLRLARVLPFLGEAVRLAHRVFARHHLHYVLVLSTALVVGSAAVMLGIEEDQGGSITSFGDAMWWAITTVTTVGYGDTFPVTPAGRGVAAFLMLMGVALFGIITANVAAFFVESAEERSSDAEYAELNEKLDRVLERLGSLEILLAEPETGHSRGG